MSSLLLHPRTAVNLARLATNLPQAILLTAPTGSGKEYTAHTWLQEAFKVAPSHIRVIKPIEKAGISVDQIRDLYRSTRTKQQAAQFYILHCTEAMSHGAQNAFLKLLEEPNDHIHFVLTATSADALLPTIQSRVQHVQLLPLDPATIQTYFQQHNLPPAEAAQIAFIAAGRIGLAASLIKNKDLLAQYRTLAADAKQWISGTAFERLNVAGRLGNDRARALTFLQLAGAMASTMLSRSTAAKDQQKWVQQLANIHDGLERIAANGNIKIQLTQLALNI